MRQRMKFITGTEHVEREHRRAEENLVAYKHHATNEMKV